MSLFRKFTETVSKGVSTATEKAQQTVEITRLHAQISGKRKEIDKLFAEIGEAVFESYVAKDLSLAEPRIIPSCERIEAIRAEIEGLENRMMELRNEKECGCGKKVPYDVRFCPSCGHPFPEPVAVVPADEGHPADSESVMELPAGQTEARSDDEPAAAGRDDLAPPEPKA